MRAAAPYAVAHEGRTTHVRFTPFERRFSYRLAQVMVDIDRVADSARALRLLSYNRFNLFSFHDRDHGDRSGAPLRAWAEDLFRRGDISLAGGRIDLLCFPRVLGFVFNPISFFFGYGPSGKLRGIIYEVNNTFGETHAYVAPVGDIDTHDHEAAKLLHVSPLFPVRGDYHFRTHTPGAHFHVAIENRVDGLRQHLATLATNARPLTDGWLVKIFMTMPLMTLNVVFAIHWQALKLFLRGARYHRKPPLPADASSVTGAHVQRMNDKQLAGQINE